MSGRKGNDLGITLAGLGYTTPTPASIGAAKSTVGGGLPAFAGRVQGDLHFDSTAAKEYVLTGAAGSTVSAASVTANTQYDLVTNSGGMTFSGHLSNMVGSAGERIYFEGTTAYYTGGYYVTYTQGNVRLTESTSGTILATAAFPGGSNTASFDYTITHDGAGGITVKVDNTVVISGTYTVHNGRYCGLEMNQGTSSYSNVTFLRNGTLAWSVSTTLAALGGVAVGTPMVYKGAWASGSTYSQNDVVNDAYGLYAALAAVPAGQGVPATASYASSVVGATGSLTANINGPTGYAYGRQAFTTGASPTTVGAVVLSWNAPNGTDAVTVGIASAVGTTPGSAITYLHTPVAVTPGAAAGNVSITVSLPSNIVLAASTTYYLVVSSTAGSGAYGWNTTLSPAASGGIASMATGQGVGTSGGSYGTYGNASTTYLFQLAGTLPYWKKIANTGNQENVGQVATSGAAVTIADPEIQPITRIVLTANCTITLPTVTSGKSFTVVLVQDATGSRTVTWAGGTVLWPGGVAPTLTTTANKGDVISFMADGGGNWLGFVGGQNY